MLMYVSMDNFTKSNEKFKSKIFSRDRILKEKLISVHSSEILRYRHTHRQTSCYFYIMMIYLAPIPIGNTQ